MRQIDCRVGHIFITVATIICMDLTSLLSHFSPHRLTIYQRIVRTGSITDERWGIDYNETRHKIRALGGNTDRRGIVVATCSGAANSLRDGPQHRYRRNDLAISCSSSAHSRAKPDRKSVVSGRSGSVRVNL